MPFKVIAKNGALTPAERRRLFEVSARLGRYFRNIVNIEWILSTERRDCLVACRVHSKSGYYRARARSNGFGESIDQAVDKVVRQRRRRKMMKQAVRRR